MVHPTTPSPPSRKKRQRDSKPVTDNNNSDKRRRPMTRSRRIEEENMWHKRHLTPVLTFVPASEYQKLERKLQFEVKRRQSIEQLLENPDQLDNLVLEMMQESKHESLENERELESRISALVQETSDLKERNRQLVAKSDALDERKFDREVTKKWHQEATEKVKKLRRENKRLQEQMEVNTKTEQKAKKNGLEARQLFDNEIVDDQKQQQEAMDQVKEANIKLLEENKRLQKQVNKLRISGTTKMPDTLQILKHHEMKKNHLYKQIQSLKCELLEQRQQKTESLWTQTALSRGHYLMLAVAAVGAAALHMK